MSELLKGLNKEQKEAVIYESGPLLLIAGAGTGKTTVITKRIAYLINERKVLPEEILALTFTDKAAAEMEERIDELVLLGAFDTWISTFHSFGDRVLRENALDLGLPSDFKVLTFPEQMVFLKENLFDLDLKILKPLSNPTRYLEALLRLFSRLKDEDISPKEYLEFVETKKEATKEWEKQNEIAKAYEKYQEVMMKNGFLDFGDQILLTLRLFRENKNILEKYRKKFKYILVDEYQDTNYAQGELIKLLCDKEANITVVADDDQSIYRFRGAAVSNVLDFKDHYNNTRQIVLNRNYRSTKEVLDSSYKLIQYNNPDRLEVKNKIDKKLISDKSGPEVSKIFTDTLSSEADEVAKIIEKKVKEGITYKDTAILIRKNSQAEAFMHALNAKKIPYKFSGSHGLYSRPEVRVILSFTNVLSDSEDSLSLFHLMTSEIYDIATEDAIRLSSKASRENITLGEMLKNPGIDLNESSLLKIKKLNDDLLRYRDDLRTSTAGQIIYSFLKESGFLKKLTSEIEDNPKADIKIQNIAKFFQRVTDFEYVSRDKSLLNFKNELDLLIEAGENPATAEVDPDIDAVNIITIHKAKGLEYEVVFLVNLVNGSFPSRKMSDPLQIPQELIKEKLPEGDFHIQEERRLFYVGMTRAKKELYLTFAEDYGGKRLKKVSPFVLETLDVPKIESKKKKMEKIELIKKFEKIETPEVAKAFYKSGILNLNPHQIDDYISCPLKFKYIHILKIPVVKHHAVVYGSAIHNAIGEYFLRRMNDMPISLKHMLNVYEGAWRTEGFIHKEHERERFEKGKKSLIKFFEKHEKEERLPSLVEDKFSFLVDGETKIKVNGRYDAVYQDKESVEIRDFKTSDVDEKDKADKKSKSNRQLSIYALSYQEMKGIMPEKLTLYFVDTGLIGESVRKEKDLEKTRDEIRGVAEGIVKGDFSSKPGYGECGRCAYKEICSFTESD